VNNTFCVIDVGTNNILLLVASIKDNFHIIKRDSKISGLGKDMKNDLLDITAIERTKKILTEFILEAQNFTENIIIVGTSCSREAKNISLLSDWLADKFQIKYNIISGKQEADFNALANINEFIEFKNVIMFDVGGGSTEFIWIENGNVIKTHSLDLGIRRLQNVHDSDHSAKLKATKTLLNSLKPVQLAQPVLVGIGGTATSLSAMKFELEKYDPALVHKSKVTKTDIINLYSKLKEKNLKQISELMPFEPKRADLIQTGTMIVMEILDYFGSEEFFVSDRGIQFGILSQPRSELDKML